MNLMPTKVTTEIQIARLLTNTPLQVRLTLLQTSSHQATHVSAAHLENFYTTFDDIRDRCFDGMIITGAPVETIPFEDVDYWKELCEVFEYTKTHVWSTLHVCWGAQAGLYYHWGIRKQLLREKLSGVYTHRVLRPANPLVRGFDEVFLAPHSRHTEVDRNDVEKQPALRVLAEGEESGLYLLSTENGRQIFVTGHPEYDRLTLDSEYRRDQSKGMAVPVPYHYYPNDNIANEPVFNWKSHAHLLYRNWLNYYVYQNTPYDLSHRMTEDTFSEPGQTVPQK